MGNARLRLLAAGVSAIAIGAGFSAPVSAAQVEGVRQDDAGTIAINLFEIDAADPPAAFGATNQVNNPGALAVASANVLCAEFATCPEAGSVHQSASGTSSARNDIDIAGSLSIGAIASATGSAASASALVKSGIYQRAVSGGVASGAIDVSGSLDIGAEAHA